VTGRPGGPAARTPAGRPARATDSRPPGRGPARGRLLSLATLLALAAPPAAARGTPPPGAVPLQDSVPATRTPAPGTAADARDAELDALAAQIAARLRCLVCRGQSVAESSSQLAREMQAEIRDRLGRGETPEQIVDFFVESYGEWILLRPPPHGVNLIVYLLPAGAFLLGLAGVGWWLRSRRAAGPHVASPTRHEDARDDGLDPEDRAWLEAAVRERR